MEPSFSALSRLTSSQQFLAEDPTLTLRPQLIHQSASIKEHLVHARNQGSIRDQEGINRDAVSTSPQPPGHIVSWSHLWLGWGRRGREGVGGVPSGLEALPASHKGFPVAQTVNSLLQHRRLGLIPRLGRFPGEGNGNPLRYSYLENPTDRGAWPPIVHRVAKSWTGPSNSHTQGSHAL